MSDSETRIDWYRSPIDKKVLAELTKRNNWRPLLHNLGMLGFSAATGALAVWAFHNLAWPWVVVTCYLHCTFFGYFGGGAGGHELSHRNMFRSAWLNEFFIRFSGFLTGFNFYLFRASHTRHHHYTVHHDLDREVMLPADLKWYQWIWSTTLHPTGFFREIRMMAANLLPAGGKANRKQWAVLGLSVDSPEYRAGLRWMRIVVLGQLALAILFVLSGNWILLIVVTFARFFANWHKGLTHIPQHFGMRPDVADWRQSTRTYLAGPIVQFFYWNMNYHVEHHMYAAVPFYNLPKLRKAIEGDLPEANYGLLATWKELLRAHRRTKENPSYYFTPKFPETATPGPGMS
jgi:fatty acid desaturase